MNTNVNVDFQSQYMQQKANEQPDELKQQFDIVELPSKGLFYKDKTPSELAVYYLTTRDEDTLTTPGLMESGKVYDVLVKRKIKDRSINPDMLLKGDIDAILLFLRSSGYGAEYPVIVTDPETGDQFESKIDLTKLKYKEIKHLPDEMMHFSIELPLRKKLVKIRLLNSLEEDTLNKNIDNQMKLSNDSVRSSVTMRLKAHIYSIDGNSNRGYINDFVDNMPPADSLTLRKFLMEIEPGIDTTYEFTSPRGNTFTSSFRFGLDFFYPSI
jgi:hypothetical protein